MSQIWKNDKVIPVTMIKAGPITVTQIKTKEKDGYEAAQIGFDLSKKKINKPLTGHLKNLGNFKCLKEFRIKNSELKIGDILDINQFQEGEKVKVSGLSKGRGFQGVVKRHGFAGSPKTHGHKDQLRMPGSIGSTQPQRVFKGTRMAGRMGGDRVTVKNLEIVSVNPENQEIVLSGAIPGAPRSFITIEAE